MKSTGCITGALYHWILNVDLHLYSYKIQTNHKITPWDKVKSVIMCKWFHDKIELSLDFPNDMLSSDETHSPCCLDMLTGNIWFEDENKEPFTVIKEWYIKVLQQNWTALSLSSSGRGPNMFRKNFKLFQQNELTPYTANMKLEWLDQQFSQHLVSWQWGFEWSPHFPDLNPLCFY